MTALLPNGLSLRHRDLRLIGFHSRPKPMQAVLRRLMAQHRVDRMDSLTRTSNAGRVRLNAGELSWARHRASAFVRESSACSTATSSTQSRRRRTNENGLGDFGEITRAFVALLRSQR